MNLWKVTAWNRLNSHPRKAEHIQDAMVQKQGVILAYAHHLSNETMKKYWNKVV